MSATGQKAPIVPIAVYGALGSAYLKVLVGIVSLMQTSQYALPLPSVLTECDTQGIAPHACRRFSVPYFATVTGHSQRGTPIMTTS